jgi:hypothetical protein
LNKNGAFILEYEEEKWYLLIVDVAGVLTESLNPNNYWKVLKHKLTKKGSELATKYNQLKMSASLGITGSV